MTAEQAIAMAVSESRRVRCRFVVVYRSGSFMAVPYKAAHKSEHLEVVRP